MDDQSATPFLNVVALNNLAKQHHQQGNYSDAVSLYEQVLEIRLQQRGARHPDTVSTYSSLLWLYEYLGQPQRADQLSRLFAQAQASSTSFGPANNQTPVAKRPEKRGQVEEGTNEPLKKQGTTGTEEESGERPLTGAELVEIAKRKLAEMEEAKTQAEMEEAKTHPERLLSGIELAKWYEERGKYEEAEAVYQHMLRSKLSGVGPNHLDTAQTYVNLARLYKQLDLYDDATTMYQWALAIFESQVGSSHPDTRQVREEYEAL